MATEGKRGEPGSSGHEDPTAVVSEETSFFPVGRARPKCRGRAGLEEAGGGVRRGAWRPACRAGEAERRERGKARGAQKGLGEIARRLSLLSPRRTFCLLRSGEGKPRRTLSGGPQLQGCSPPPAFDLSRIEDGTGTQLRADPGLCNTRGE